MYTAPDRDARPAEGRRADPDARFRARRIDCAERQRAAPPPARGGSRIEAEPHGRTRPADA